MRDTDMRFLATLMACLLATPLHGQDTGSLPKFRLGLFGFGAQIGVDFAGDDQLVVGSALDLGNVYGERLRLRGSAELGVGSEADTYVFSGELILRFLSEDQIAVPYIGGGVGLYTQAGCGAAEGCPDLWLQFALGFEVRIRSYIAWFIEYHGEDVFNHNRLFIGLTTKRGI